MVRLNNIGAVRFLLDSDIIVFAPNESTRRAALSCKGNVCRMSRLQQ
jgi:hypothetical protein